MAIFSLVDPADLIEFCKAVAQEPCSEVKRAAFERIYALACYNVEKGQKTMYINGQLADDFADWLIG